MAPSSSGATEIGELDHARAELDQRHQRRRRHRHHLREPAVERRGERLHLAQALERQLADARVVLGGPEHVVDGGHRRVDFALLPALGDARHDLPEVGLGLVMVAPVA
jgi:hypothetical protein